MTATPELTRRRRTARGTAVLAALVLASVVAFIWLAPTWLTILVVLGLAVIGSVWATRPPKVSLGRHVAALIGQVILDVLRTVLRAIVGVIVVIALVVALWSFAAPRIEAQIGQWRDSAVGSAKSAVQSAVPVPHLPSITLPWGGSSR